jgi:hypothetical protein
VPSFCDMSCVGGVSNSLGVWIKVTCKECVQMKGRRKQATIGLIVGACWHSMKPEIYTLHKITQSPVLSHALTNVQFSCFASTAAQQPSCARSSPRSWTSSDAPGIVCTWQQPTGLHMMPRYAQYAVPHPLFAPALVKMVDPRLSETDPPRVHMVFTLVDNPHRWQMHWTSYRHWTHWSYVS